nr:tetratricopeptide repeat protein [uncultured Holophaga sp.]
MPKAVDIALPSPPIGERLAEAGQLANRREALALVRQALEEAPDHPEALRLGILLDNTPPREKALRLRALAESLEEEPPGGEVLLRTLMALARTLEQSSKPREAVPLYEKVLKLAPGDPLEARHHLARCLLELGRLKELRELRERCLEPGALRDWILVLELLKTERPSGLVQALEAARLSNPYVEDFLTSRRRVPKHRTPEEEQGPGSLAEALHILDLIGEAWFKDRSALSRIMNF